MEAVNTKNPIVFIIATIIILALSSCGERDPSMNAPSPTMGIEQTDMAIEGEVFLEGPISVIVNGKQVYCVSDVYLVRRDSQNGSRTFMCDGQYSRIAWADNSIVVPEPTSDIDG